MVDPWSKFLESSRQLNDTIQQMPQQNMRMMLMGRRIQDENNQRDIYRNADPNNPEATVGALYKGGYGKEAMSLQQAMQAAQASKFKSAAEMYKLSRAAAEHIAAQPDDLILQAYETVATHLGKQTGQDPTQQIEWARRTAQQPGGLAAIRQQAEKQAGLMKIALTNTGDGHQVVSYTPSSGATPVGEKVPINVSPNVQSRQGMKVEHGASPLSPEENEALFGENGAVTMGRLDPARVNSRTAKIFAQGELLSPGRTDFVSITGDAALAKNAQFRTKAMVAESLPEIMQSTVEAGKKLNYPEAKFAGAAKQWMLGQINDPDLAAYMTLRNDSLMTIASVMRGVGMTDMAHRAEVEAMSPTMTPEALDAWYGAQMKALEPRLKQYRKVAKVKDGGDASPEKEQQPKGGGIVFEGFE